MLQDDEVTSNDFNVKALQSGEISRYMGFNFLETQLLDNGVLAADVTTCFCWARSGIKLAIGIEPRGRVSERPDKNYSTQVYYEMDIGATRMEEAKVVQIACDESP